MTSPQHTPLKVLDDGTAFGSVGMSCSMRRTGADAIRQGATQAILAPAVIAIYLTATLGAPNRPLMLAVVMLMAIISVLSLRFAAKLAAHPLSAAISAAGVVYFLLGGAALGYLDGGIASPLGAICLFSLPFIAMTVPPKLVLLASAVSIGGYWVVALSIEPVDYGRAMAYSLMFAALTAACSTHSRTLARLKRRLTYACRRDPLSGCLNRRGFDDALINALGRRAEPEPQLALVAIDLDRFKTINDMYGHKAGDDAISFVGQQLREAAGANGLVARAGGDEFVIALIGAGKAEATQWAQRAQAALAPYVSASVGIGHFPQDADRIVDALRVADLEAYSNKQLRVQDEVEPPVRPPVSEIGAAPRVSKSERRTRSIASMSTLLSVNYLIGLMFVLSQDIPNKGWLLGLISGALAVSTAMGLATSRIAASENAGPLMLLVGLLLTANGIPITILAGGIESPIAMGWLLPMAFVALATPLKTALPIVFSISTGYAGVAFTVGSPDFWYAYTHLASMVAISAAGAAQCYDSAMRRRELDRIGRFDELTQCLTRSAFEEQVLQDAESKGSLDDWLMAIDLNAFKRLNDLMGHAAGDELLEWVGKRFRAELQSEDLLARFGGDEFVIALRNYSHEDAVAATGRLAESIAPRASASFGLAKAGRTQDAFDAGLSLADSRMYAEKTIGRQGELLVFSKPF